MRTSSPSANGTRPGRLALVGAWFDPTDPRIWSGMFHHVTTELEAMGVFAGHRDATPWAPAARLVHRWLRATGRATASWTLRPEALALARVSDPWIRRRPPRRVDATLVPQGTVGRPAADPLVLWCDLSPAQLVAAGPELAAGFGLPEVTARQLHAAADAQLALHRRAVATCAVSHWTARSLVHDHGLPADRVHVVGCGRNVDVTPPPQRDWSTPRLLFVGNDWRRKNGDAVVRCFTRLRQEHPTARLDVAGQHPPLDVPGVIGHGPLRFDQPGSAARLAALFRTATCFVMPSVLEPFGIVYVEAAAAGVPSIAGTSGGTTTSVGDGGILVPPTDDRALLDAMRRVCQPAVAGDLGARAQRRSAAFTWRLVAERLLRASGLAAPDGRTLAHFLDDDTAGSARTSTGTGETPTSAGAGTGEAGIGADATSERLPGMSAR